MKRFFLSMAVIAAAVSCSKEQISDELNYVSARSDDFEYGEVFTRTAITQKDSQAPAFAWGEGDVIGVIPLDGKTVQSNFEILGTGSDPRTATFDGGVWALKEGGRYAAYYPFRRVAADCGDELEFSFLGQTQRGNNSLEHIGDYDYMFAPSVTASSSSTTFVFKHLISLIRFQITVPQADEYTALTLESTASWFAAKAKLSLSDGTMTSTQDNKSCTVVLGDIASGSGEVLTVWLATLPTRALNNRKLTLKLIGKNTSRTMELSGLGNFEAGKAYSFSCSAASSQSEMEGVDLGLSVKWANVNLGAKSPEENGDYYAWGELKPYYKSGDSQNTWEEGKSGGYAWSSYCWCNGTANTMTKYCTDTSYGTQDGKNKLMAEDDAAYAELGGKWRMPSDAEFQELLDKCRTEWTSLNGVKGINVTGPNGNSIFLPAAGYRTGAGTYLKGLYGYYWSSSLSETKSCNAFCLYFSQYLISTNNNEINNRCFGQTIRPVFD